MVARVTVSKEIVLEFGTTNHARVMHLSLRAHPMTNSVALLHQSSPHRQQRFTLWMSLIRFFFFILTVFVIIFLIVVVIFFQPIKPFHRLNQIRSLAEFVFW